MKYKVSIYLKSGGKIKVRSYIKMNFVKGSVNINLCSEFENLLRDVDCINYIDGIEAIITKKWWQTWG